MMGPTSRRRDDLPAEDEGSSEHIDADEFQERLGPDAQRASVTITGQ